MLNYLTYKIVAYYYTKFTYKIKLLYKKNIIFLQF